jgi:hypothetical protein
MNGCNDSVNAAFVAGFSDGLIDGSVEDWTGDVDEVPSDCSNRRFILAVVGGCSGTAARSM